MGDIVCQVSNRDRDDRIEFIWSAGGGFFDPYIVRGTELAELRTTADQVRDVLETLVVTLNRAQGQMEAIPWELSYEFAEAGFRLFNDLLPPENSTAKVVRRWLEGLHVQSGLVALEIVVEEDPDQVEQFLAIPWNLVYDQRPARYKDAFQTGQGVERWRPFWAIRYNLTSGRRVDPWRRLSDWTDPRVVAVIDPKAREGLRAEERRDLDVFLKEFGFEPISAPSPPGRTDATQVRTQVGSLDELEAALEAGYPRLLYWLGHAQPDYLMLGDERISPADLRNLLRTYDDRDRPEGMLAFLNACRTAEPGSKDSFLHVLHRFGFTGAIVTERQTIDNFANRFGLKFLRGFLQDGKPLGTLLHELRLDAAPLGLLYGAHCPPEIHVRVGPEPALTPPEIHEAQPVTGHPLDASLVALGRERQAETLTLPDQPYRSLAYYDYADRLLFTGRDADIVRFAATLDQPDTRILVLHGESGIGKSSFLRAGVIPYLEEECVGYRFLRDAAGQVVIIQASKDPVGRLAAGLLEMTERRVEYLTPTGDVRTIDLRPVLDEALGTQADAATLRAALMEDPARLATLLELLSAHLPHALVLVLDQAEELFTLAKTPEEIAARDQALRLLQRVADVRADVKVIVSLRTEYYGRLLDHLRAGRRDLTGVRDDLLRDFSKPALIEAIERPTLETPLVEGQPAPRQRYGFRYAPGVPETIANGLLKLRSENQDSVLPLMQVICTRLYERDRSKPNSDDEITKEDLKSLQRDPNDTRPDAWVVDALRAFAEDALERTMGLGLADRDAFQSLYTNLYTRQADGTLTTWLAPRANLEADWNGSGSFGEVLEAACEVRLLREDVLRIEGEEPQAYVRLGHDALAKVAAAWRAEREKQEQLRFLIRGLVVSVLLAVIFALGGLKIYWNNLELDRKNLELDQTNTALKKAEEKAKTEEKKAKTEAENARFAEGKAKTEAENARFARDNAKRQEHIARARLARSVFDQVDSLWRTWPEGGQQLLVDVNNFRLSERDFTWGYYMHLCDRVRVLKGHEGVVSAVAFSPNGKTLASAGEGRAVRLWDPATGEARATLTGHEGAVSAVAFSPDGKTLASVGGDPWNWDKPGELRLWDAATGATRAALKGHKGVVSAVAFSPDGKTLASAGRDKTVRLWDAATGATRATLTGHEDWVWAVAFSPDGRTLASAGGDPLNRDKLGELRLWDVATGATRATLKGHEDWVWAVAFSPDGKTLASAGRDKTVRLWDAATGEARATLTGHEGWVYAVAFSPDGKTLASAGDDGTVRLWDAATGATRATLKGHENWVRAVAFSPDGKTLASAGEDGTVRLWDAAIGATAPPSRGTRARCPPWPSAPTARPSPPRARTGRCGCGTRRPAGPAPPSRGTRTG